MARATEDGLSISELERMLEGRRQDLNKKVRERDRLRQRLEAVEEEIARLGGERSGRRARNEVSLQQTLEVVLKQAGKPMKVSDIADAVQKAGYRSNSANFRGIVNQTLIKDKRFASAGRGMYVLKKGRGEE